MGSGGSPTPTRRRARWGPRLKVRLTYDRVAVEAGLQTRLRDRVSERQVAAELEHAAVHRLRGALPGAAERVGLAQHVAAVHHVEHVHVDLQLLALAHREALADPEIDPVNALVEQGVVRNERDGHVRG